MNLTGACRNRAIGEAMAHVEGEVRSHGIHRMASWRADSRPAWPAASDPRPAGNDAEPDEIARAMGDPAAFAPLYERYVDAVFGYCYRRTSDRELAADLTGQIFAQALAALPHYRPERGAGTFRSWLFAIAHNLVIDSHRTRRPHASIDSVAARSLHDRSPSPEDDAIANERRDALGVALRELTEGQRQIVELRLAGLTGPEIAAVLGMRLAAVKSAQFRAYARLRDLLHHLVDDGPDAPSVFQERSDA